MNTECKQQEWAQKVRCGLFFRYWWLYRTSTQQGGVHHHHHPSLMFLATPSLARMRDIPPPTPPPPPPSTPHPRHYFSIYIYYFVYSNNNIFFITGFCKPITHTCRNPYPWLYPQVWQVQVQVQLEIPGGYLCHSLCVLPKVQTCSPYIFTSNRPIILNLSDSESHHQALLHNVQVCSLIH